MAPCSNGASPWPRWIRSSLNDANNFAFFGLYPRRWAAAPYAERYLSLVNEPADVALACQHLALLLTGKDGEEERITALYDRALGLVDEASPRRRKLLMALGVHLTDIGDLATLQRRCASVLERTILGNRASHLKSALALRKQDVPGAIQVLSLEGRPGFRPFKVAIQDDWPAALGTFARRLARERLRRRGDAEGHTLLGLARLASGHVGDAVASYERALARTRNHPAPRSEAHARVAYAACVAADLDTAVEHARRAYQLRCPDGAPADVPGVLAAVNYASILAARGEFRTAHDVLDAALPVFWQRPDLREPFRRHRYRFDAVESLLREFGRVDDVRAAAEALPVSADKVESVYSAAEAARLTGRLREALRLERAHLRRYEEGALNEGNVDWIHRRLVQAELMLEIGLEDEALAELLELQARLEGSRKVRESSSRTSAHATALACLEGLAEALLRRGLTDQGRAVAERAYERHRSFGLGPTGRMLPPLRMQTEHLLVLPVLALKTRPLPPLDSRAPETYARALHLGGRSDAAVRILDDTLASLRARVPPESPRVGRALNELAKIELAVGWLEDAQQHAAAALRNAEAALGPDHPDVADAAITAGDVALLAGRPAEARRHYERSLAVSRAELHPTHVNFVLAGSGLALSRSEEGDHARAVAGMREVLDLVAARLERSFAGATGRARVRMLASVQWVLANWLKVSAAAREVGYDEVLRLKVRAGRSLAAEAGVLRAAKGKAKAVAEALDRARRELAHLAHRAPLHSWRRHAWRRQVAESAARVDALTRQLERASPEFRRGRKTRTVDARAVASRLLKNEALVDVLLTGGRYTAWVLKKGQPVRRVELGPEGPLTERLRAFRDATRKASDATAAAFRATGAAVREALLDPLRAMLAEPVDTLYLVPDGPLAATPLAALPLADGTHLLDRFTLVRLQAAQDLLPRPTKARTKGALLVGDVDFNIAERPGAAAKPVITGKRKVLAERVPGMPRFVDLPATAAEIASIERRVRRVGRVVVLRGTRATEARLRGAAPGKRVLHLATHGLIRDLNTRLRVPGDGVLRLREGLERYAQGFDPFLMSGIALAGVNARETEGLDDGLLTGLEVLTLDLQGTELAFLSACDTARGVEQAGDGVLGLARAFTLAGARQVVASLWRVEDEATLALVERFYEAYLAGTRKPAATALREAALSLRADEKYRAPRHWAAFGAYGPLR